MESSASYHWLNASSMASVVRLVRLVCSAHWSREAAASTDFREQPETPGPQPRQGSKASDVPVMLNSEFSSKFGRRPEVLASLVVLGMFSLDALAELLAGGGSGAGAAAGGGVAASQQAEGQCRAEQQRNEPFLDHGGFLLFINARRAAGEHFGSYF